MNNYDEREQVEFSEFLFGPRDNPDGTEPLPSHEERLRQDSLVLHARALAKKHGIEIESTTIRPADSATPTNRALEIKHIADAAMPVADAAVRTSIDRAKVTLPDGTTYSRMRIQLGFLDRLSETIKSLMPGSIRGKLRICIRAGRLAKIDTEASITDET